MSNLNDLASLAHGTEIAHGFSPATMDDWTHGNNVVPMKIALIHSEASEALEAFRVDDLAEFGRELADIIIRTLGVAGGLGFDMDQIVSEKMVQNALRPHKHGGKRI